MADSEAASLRALCRTGGALYLFVITSGIVQQLLVRARIFVGGDAAATAANLRSMESWWRAGIAIELGMLAATVALTWVLYRLLRPVDADLSLLATLFALVAVATEASFTLRAVEALFPLGGATYLRELAPGQTDAMAHLAARAHVFGFGVALLLFAPFFLVTGRLIFRSRFLPRGLGVLYAISGASYLVHGLALVLAPRLADRVFAVVAGPAFLGEASLGLWLLVRGIAPESGSLPRERRSRPPGSLRGGAEEAP
jgi:hypothetical protein